MPGRPIAHERLRRLLSGGDRRSLARSVEALSLVRRAPRLVAEVAALADSQDPLVSMRAMDLLEKLAHAHPEWVQPHKRLFIGPHADSDRWEIRLQVVRALPLLTWTTGERPRVLEILRREVRHPQTFVRAWALDGLATFAQRDGRLLPLVRRLVAEFERSGKKALATRARHVRARLVAPRPVWICPRCGARLVSRDLWHSCGRFTLEALFARSAPECLALARRTVAFVRSLGDIQVIPQKTRLVFVARVRFAGITAWKDHVLLTFALHRRLASSRVVKCIDYGPRWQAHEVRIRSLADLDGELRRWLRESLDLVGLQRK